MLSFQQLTQLNCVIAVENILTQANYFNLSDPTVVLYGRAGQGLEISKRNRSFPPLVQALMASVQSAPVCRPEQTLQHCSRGEILQL